MFVEHVTRDDMNFPRLAEADKSKIYLVMATQIIASVTLVMK